MTSESIEFHCQHCSKLIKAPHEYAGKRGKCPHCHQSVYIPTPTDELEPLHLAPFDDAPEREKEKVEAETHQVIASLRGQRDVPPDVPRQPTPEPQGDVRLQVDVEHLIIEYVLAMAAGRLDEAKQLAADLRNEKARTNEYVQRLTMDELLPARLAKVPRAVVLGFLKQLQKG
jgi:phage FluMu protein Com